MPENFKSNRFSILWWALGLCGVLVLGISLVFPQVPRLLLFAVLVNSEMRREHPRGDFGIHLEMVDEQGRPVNNVKISAERTVSLSLKGSKYDIVRQTVNGRLDADYDDCYSLRINFMHPNYHREQVAYNYRDKPPGMTTHWGRHIYNGRVVMREVGAFTTTSLYVAAPAAALARRTPLPRTALKEVDFTLSWRSGEGYLVLDLTQLNGKASRTECREGVTDPASAATPTLYTGMPPGWETMPPRFNQHHVEMAPEGFYALLNMNGPDGEGFFPVESKELPEREMKIRMIEAPEKGYVPTLKIPFYVFRYSMETGDRRPACFFFKLNGQYGKGMVKEARVHQSKGQLEMRIDLWIQPDGSRNVVTAEW